MTILVKFWGKIQSIERKALKHTSYFTYAKTFNVTKSFDESNRIEVDDDNHIAAGFCDFVQLECGSFCATNDKITLTNLFDHKRLDKQVVKYLSCRWFTHLLFSLCTIWWKCLALSMNMWYVHNTFNARLVRTFYDPYLCHSVQLSLPKANGQQCPSHIAILPAITTTIQCKYSTMQRDALISKTISNRFVINRSN